jgi:hypothetical protein
MGEADVTAAIAGVRTDLTARLKAGEVRRSMIKPREAFAARSCENIHKQSLTISVCTGRVVVAVESRV